MNILYATVVTLITLGQFNFGLESTRSKADKFYENLPVISDGKEGAMGCTCDSFCIPRFRWYYKKEVVHV